MTEHVPSIVAELPPDRWLYCLICSQKWPCPNAPIEEYVARAIRRERLHSLSKLQQPLRGKK